MITSASNQLVKHIKKLQTKKAYRFECGEFVIEGVRQIFDAKKYITKVVADENFEVDTSEFNCPVEIVSSKIFSSLSETDSPQGILATAKINLSCEEDILKKDGFYVFCDSVRDPGNLGSIIRTSDAAGVDAIILSNTCVDLFNPKTVRSTMSSIFNVPVCISGDSIKTIDFFKNNGVNIIGSSPHCDKLIYNENYKSSVMLVVGNEANGISDEVLTCCTSCVKIPMAGNAESLGVAAASAVFIYEAFRQRTF